MSEIDKLGGKVQWLEEKIAEKNALLAEAAQVLENIVTPQRLADFPKLSDLITRLKASAEQ